MVAGIDNPRRSWKLATIGILITVICLTIFLTQIDFAATYDAFTGVEPRWLLIALSVLAADYILKIFRWRYLLEICDARVSFWRCMPPFMGAIALNNLLPMRSGDVSRVFIFPAAIGVSRSMGAASLYVERAMDLWSVLILLIMGVLFFPVFSGLPAFLQDPMVKALVVAFALIAPATPIVAAATIARHLERWWKDPNSGPKVHGAQKIVVMTLAGLVKVLGMISLAASPARLLAILIVSVGCWMLEAGFYMAVAKSVGINLSWGSGLILMGASTLTTLIPAAPGYFGSFHLAQLATFGAIGVSSDIAGAATVLIHLLLWGSTTIWGLAHILASPSLFKFELAKSSKTGEV